MIRKDRIASFDPFSMKAFACPVCGTKEFVELVPAGGVWCVECNARFVCDGTCDGLRKISVRCTTNYIFKEYMDQVSLTDLDGKVDEADPDIRVKYGTVIWEDDEIISWLRL